MPLTIDLDLHSDKLLVTLPNGSHVRVPPTEKGAIALFKILEAQRSHGGQHHNKTGSPQVPIQYRVDAFLSGRTENPTFPVQKLAPRSRKLSFSLSLEDLGL